MRSPKTKNKVLHKYCSSMEVVPHATTENDRARGSQLSGRETPVVHIIVLNVNMLRLAG